MYVLECDDQTLYTGITTDLGRRTEQHNTSCQGAKYTQSRRPVKMVYSSDMPNKSEAQKEEHLKLTKKEKIKLIIKSNKDRASQNQILKELDLSACPQAENGLAKVRWN